MNRDAVCSLCASLLLGLCAMAASFDWADAQETVLGAVDVHFIPPNIEIVPPGNPRAGDTVNIVTRLALDSRHVWTKVGVVLDRGGGSTEAWEVNTPSVIYDAGEYKMWYGGTDGTFPHGWIHYATSSDSIMWIKHGPVLSPGPPGETANVHFPSVMKDGSTYKMWYSAYDGANYRIFYASSIDGISWVRQGLVLDLGPPGSYDDVFVYRPFVMRDGVYKMWYAGFDGSNVRLLYAISPNGVTWSRQGVALDLGPPGSPEDKAVYMNTVLREGSGYQMWYTGNDGAHSRIFYATSSDGITWTRRGLAVDIGAFGTTDDTLAGTPWVIHVAGDLYQMWYAGRDGSYSVDRIHYAYMNAVSVPVNVIVDFYVDGFAPGNWIGANVTQMDNLGPATVGVDWIAQPPGWHTICAVIDPWNAIPETSETNNTACINVLVQPGLDYLPVQTQPGPYTVIGSSRPLNLSLKVYNQGYLAPGASATLAFYDDVTPAAPFAEFAVPPVPPSSTSAPFNTTWVSPATTGLYRVTANVDYYDNVLEWNESNNNYTWTVQVVPGPATSLVIGQPNYTSRVTYITSSTPLDLSVLDNSGTGIRRMMYTVDNITWNDYWLTGQFTISGEGQHYLEWYSEDNAGNVENKNWTLLRVDDTPPTTSIQLGAPMHQGAHLFVTSSTPIDLTAVDGGVTPVGVEEIAYQIDSSGWQVYSSRLYLTEEGIHPVEYTSEDHLANADSIRTLQVVVDDTPPTTSMDVGDPKHDAADLFVTSATPFSLTARDGGAIPVGLQSVLYRIDGGDWTLYSSPFTLHGSDGSKTIEYMSRDLLGNEEDVGRLDVVLDNSPPSSSLVVGTPNHFRGEMFVSSRTWLTIQLADRGEPPVGIDVSTFRVWSGEWSQWRVYSTRFNLTGHDGVRFIEFYSTDLLGNEQGVHNVTLTLDNTPPSLSLEPDSTRVSQGTMFRLSADDGDGCGLATVWYMIDAGTWTEYSTQFALTIGQHVITYVASDNLGNAAVRTRSVEVVTAEKPPEGLVESNYKPMIAAIFTIGLLLFGMWSSRRAPWKGEAGKKGTVKAFAVFSMPFVVTEVATGIFSLVTGELRIPPAFGLGTFVDTLVLAVGIAVAVLKILKKRPRKNKDGYRSGKEPPAIEHPQQQ